MRTWREHLTLLLSAAVWPAFLGNCAALVGREAHRESSVLPAAPRTNTHTRIETMRQSQMTGGASLRFGNRPTPTSMSVRVCINMPLP